MTDAAPPVEAESGDFGFSDRDVAAETEAPAADDQAAEVDAPALEPLPADTTGTATTGERIIKEGTVTLQVDPGDFDTAFAQVIARARELGGHVASSSSSSDDVRPTAEDEPPLVSGQVTIRVPVRNFEDLLTVIGEAGRITDRSITSQDVTAEFTDLESRRRHLQAQERFYLGLLDQAEGVSDAIAVQQQLNGLQGQIEEITGRLNLLGDRTSFSTLTIRIREQAPGTPIEIAELEPGRLAPYLEDAADVFVATIGGIIVVATFLAPFMVLALLGYALWRNLRGDRRRPRDHRAEDAPAPPSAPQAPVTVGAPPGDDR
ncbi:DUF4349 domain-containing protein [soil metagenome]